MRGPFRLRVFGITLISHVRIEGRSKNLLSFSQAQQVHCTNSMLEALLPEQVKVS